MKIAIVIVTYNRLNSLKRLINSLDIAEYNREDKVPLIISIDKSDTNLIEEYSRSLSWKHGPKIIDAHTHNLGLKNHMLSLGKWFDKYDALVILEDDVVVSKYFYNYVCQSVDKYYDNPKIAGIALYSYSVNYINSTPFLPVNNGYDVYMMNTAVSWGQVWLKNQWRTFYEWYLKHEEFQYNPILPINLYSWTKSWLKYHIRYVMENNLYFIFPYVSLSTNFSDVGEHNQNNQIMFQVPLLQGSKLRYNFPNLEEAICYDGNFEWKELYSILTLSEDELKIEINSSSSKKARFELSTEIKHYKIIKSFGIKYRPIELNVINGIAGNDIFLYDTATPCKNTNKKSRLIILSKYYLYDSFQFNYNYGYFHVISELYNRIVFKLKKCLKNILDSFIIS